MWLSAAWVVLACLLERGISAPSGFPASGNGLWYTKPGGVWSREWLPVGNGYLGAMTPGGTTKETTQLNIESLWSGGPFEDPLYNGGNKQPSEQGTTASVLRDIENKIFTSPNGEIDTLLTLTTEAGAYGSYAGAGYLISNINSTGTISNYARWLDLDDGVARTTWTQGGNSYIRETFCSHPTKSCTHRTGQLANSRTATLPELSYVFSSAMEEGLPTPNITCHNSNTLRIRGLISSPRGMLYELLASVSSSGPSSKVTCVQFPVPFGAPFNASVIVTGAQEAWVTWVGDTNYDINAGDEAHSFSFQGPDPHDSLVRLLFPPSLPAVPNYARILKQHVDDFRTTLSGSFALSLGQTPDLNTPTDVLQANYKTDVGNPHLEWLLFNYGRYMLVSSGRSVLPANLQGKWAHGYGNAWSADANINIQMNYWSADMTDIDVNKPLFDLLEKTWAPRGAYTARVLYNVTRGWVTHNEIFGHTGMKAYENYTTALWANYPEAAVWMMLHVWDHFDYTNDVAWWKEQGWPLLKGVVSFQLDRLQKDRFFNDNTLVTNPCNSPEQEPITFGCAHTQQMLWQIFNSVEKGFAASGDTDRAFLEEVRTARAQLDKGIHIGSWGQLQEWKIEKDSPSDLHRHLSHLIGLYPGYAISGYEPQLQGGVLVNGTRKVYTKDEVIKAAATSLQHRGPGTGPDADSGWEKAWRAAAWAQLGDADQFYHILTYAIDINFGANLFSLYNPYNPDPIFQIDANLAYPATVMNALLQAPDVPTNEAPLIITLLPALPKQWSNGSIRGAKVRGGITIDFSWRGGRLTSATLKVGTQIRSRRVQVVYGGSVLRSFTSSAGLIVSIPVLSNSAQ
ncbi:hypothetical protein AX16_000821 [Volvariella volvacea WC 439]|nr:hypothetical protein AX16_000821 [Volvariella volvacea WC 439]